MNNRLLAGSVPLGFAIASFAARSAVRAEPCTACGSSKQLLASVLDRIPDLVLLVDAAGAIRYANTSARVTYRLDVGDDLLSPEAIHEADVESIRRSWSRLVEMQGKAMSEEMRIRRGGTWRRLLVTAENLLGDPPLAALGWLGLVMRIHHEASTAGRLAVARSPRRNREGREREERME